MDLTAAEDHLLRGAGGHLHACPDDGSAPPELSPSDIYLQNAPLMRRIATRRFNVPGPDAENLVHDVFTSYLANPQRVRNDIRPYLVASICNASRHYWRDRHVEWRVIDREAEVEDAGSVAAAEQEGLANAMLVASAMARLDPRCRRILESYYLRGDPTPDIACDLCTSNSNVNYLMHICRRRARAIFESLSRRRT